MEMLVLFRAFSFSYTELLQSWDVASGFYILRRRFSLGYSALSGLIDSAA